MQVSVNIGGLHLREIFKKCVAMNLVVPVSRNCLNNFFFQFLVDEGKSELVVGRALSVE